MIPVPTSINQPSCGPLSLVLDPELKLPSDSALGLLPVHNSVDPKDPDLPLDFPRKDNKGTINEVNDQSRDSFLDDIDDLLDDPNFSFRNKKVSPYDVKLIIDGGASQRDEKPNSDVERNFDLFVSTDRNTPEALMEQPTHSSPNPTATRRRSKRLNRERD